MFGQTCGTCRLHFFRRRATGAASVRPSLRPPSDFEGGRDVQLGRQAPRGRASASAETERRSMQRCSWHPHPARRFAPVDPPRKGEGEDTAPFVRGGSAGAEAAARDSSCLPFRLVRRSHPPANRRRLPCVTTARATLSAPPRNLPLTVINRTLTIHRAKIAGLEVSVAVECS